MTDPHRFMEAYVAGLEKAAENGHEGAQFNLAPGNYRAVEPQGRALVEMLVFFERFDEEKYGTDGGPLHDPTVIGYLLNPDLFQGREINVEIETGSDLTLGMTVADWWRVTDRPANALFIKDIDDEGFFTLLTERLATL